MPKNLNATYTNTQHILILKTFVQWKYIWILLNNTYIVYTEASAENKAIINEMTPEKFDYVIEVAQKTLCPTAEIFHFRYQVYK